MPTTWLRITRFAITQCGLDGKLNAIELEFAGKTVLLDTTGPATADGTITLYIAGQRVRVSVLDGDAQNDIAAAINTAIGLMPEIPFTSAVSTNVVTLTGVHKGTVSNVTVRKNHRGLASGEELPGGVGVAIAQTATGATDPDIGDAFAALGADDAFRYILFPWPDDTTLDAVQAEMESRWGPTRGKRGHAYTALRDTHSNLVSAGEGRTVDSHISVFGIEDTAAAPAYELAASALGRRAAVADNSASKPPRGQKLVTGSDADDLLLGAPPADQFDWSERNTLLAAGLATLVSSGTAMSIERIVTLYKNNPVTGLPDTKFRDDTTLLVIWSVVTDTRLRSVHHTSCPLAASWSSRNVGRSLTDNAQSANTRLIVFATPPLRPPTLSSRTLSA